MEDALEEILDSVEEALILGIMCCAICLRFLFGSNFRRHAGGRSGDRALIVRAGNRACKEDVRLSHRPVADLVLNRTDHFFVIRFCRAGCAALLDCFLRLRVIRHHFGSQAVKRYLFGNAHIPLSGNRKGNRITSVDILAKTHETGVVDRILLLIIRDFEFTEVIEPVIKQLNRVIELVGRLLHEDHADELHAVSLRARHKRLPGHFHIAGLAADNSFVFDLAVDQLVLIKECKLFRLPFRGFHKIGGRIGNRAEFFMREEFSGNQGHIIGACIVLFIKQTVRIDKVGILTAKLFCSRIHHIREFVQRTAHFFSKARCHFVGGSDEQRIQTLLYCECLSRIDSNAGTAELNAVHCRL